VAAKIFNKFKEPKYAEFSRKDLVVDIKSGDLYYKSNLGVHKVPNEISSDTFGLPPIIPIPAVETFKASGIRQGDSIIDGTLTIIGDRSSSLSSSNYLPDGFAEIILSSSGAIFADLKSSSTPQSVYFNITTGELSYGASYVNPFTPAGISGSWQSQTFATVTAAAISGSWQSQNFISASQTFLATGQRSGSAAITGSLTVTGTITAQEFHTEFISSSIIYESGSTQFGNTSDDTHSFTGTISVSGSGVGHITASGNISASGTLYGSEAYIKGHITASENISASGTLYGSEAYIKGHITASENISASGTLYGSEAYIKGHITASENISASGTLYGSEAYIKGHITASENISASGTLYGSEAYIKGHITASENISASGTLYGSEAYIKGHITASENISASGTLYGSEAYIKGHITASENISASGTLYGSEAYIKGHITASENISASGTLYGSEAYIKGHITASGNISASGLLYSSASLGFDNISIYNSSSGQYFYTSSQGLSEQLDTFKVTGQRTGDSAITGSLTVTTHLTASGNISASGTGSFSDGRFTGKVGIGTTSPQHELHVEGVARVRGELMVGDSGATNTPSATLHIKDSGTNAKLRIEDTDNLNTYFDFLVDEGNGLYINEASDTRLSIKEGGNVGIGTTTPTEKLQVTGNISASGTLFSSSSLGFDNIATYNSQSGQYHYTSSQGLSGQLDTFKVTGQRNGDSAITGSLDVTNGITSSGNISSSGYLYIQTSQTAFGTVLAIDEATGQVYHKLGILSSSAQIAADISGSWQGQNFISSSGEIAADISGSWQGQNFISSSGEIAADISGSWQGQGFISASQTFLVTGQRSGSAGITGSLTISDPDPTLILVDTDNNFDHQILFRDSLGVDDYKISTSGGVFNLGSITNSPLTLITNNNAALTVDVNQNVGIGTFNPSSLLDVDGNILGESITSSNDISASGTLYGSEAYIKGHITASENISASGTLYGSEAYIKGHITASGNISASGHIKAGLNNIENLQPKNSTQNLFQLL
jgi:predicted acyltransferase (DUF342 family)